MLKNVSGPRARVGPVPRVQGVDSQLALGAVAQLALAADSQPVPAAGSPLALGVDSQLALGVGSLQARAADFPLALAVDGRRDRVVDFLPGQVVAALPDLTEIPTSGIVPIQLANSLVPS